MRHDPTERAFGIDLYRLPLGAGGRFVAFNGRLYEAVVARHEHREPLHLFHTALVVTVPDGRFAVENAWPIPDSDGASRGAMVEGPVGLRALGHLRVFRYEVRCWRDGVIADVTEAVDSPQRVSDDERLARRVLDLVPEVPPLLWGRHPGSTPEMWNSNSVISWLLTRSGIEVEQIHPPPGWTPPGMVNRNSSRGHGKRAGGRRLARPLA